MKKLIKRQSGGSTYFNPKTFKQDILNNSVKKDAIIVNPARTVSVQQGNYDQAQKEKQKSIFNRRSKFYSSCK